MESHHFQYCWMAQSFGCQAGDCGWKFNSTQPTLRGLGQPRHSLGGPGGRDWKATSKYTTPRKSRKRLLSIRIDLTACNSSLGRWGAINYIIGCERVEADTVFHLIILMDGNVCWGKHNYMEGKEKVTLPHKQYVKIHAGHICFFGKKKKADIESESNNRYSFI